MRGDFTAYSTARKDNTSMDGSTEHNKQSTCVHRVRVPNRMVYLQALQPNGAAVFIQAPRRAPDTGNQ